MFSGAPEPHIAFFCPTHFFPCLNPIFKNGSFLSVVALVSVTLSVSNPRPSAEKRSNLATTTIELPECQQLGKNNMVRVCVKASPADKNTAHAHLFGVSTGLSAEHCRPQASSSMQKIRLKVQRWVSSWVFSAVFWGVKGV